MGVDRRVLLWPRAMEKECGAGPGAKQKIFRSHFLCLKKLKNIELICTRFAPHSLLLPAGPVAPVRDAEKN